MRQRRYDAGAIATATEGATAVTVPSPLGRSGRTGSVPGVGSRGSGRLGRANDADVVRCGNPEHGLGTVEEAPRPARRWLRRPGAPARPENRRTPGVSWSINSPTTSIRRQLLTAHASNADGTHGQAGTARTLQCDERCPWQRGRGHRRVDSDAVPEPGNAFHVKPPPEHDLRLALRYRDAPRRTRALFMHERGRVSGTSWPRAPPPTHFHLDEADALRIRGTLKHRSLRR